MAEATETLFPEGFEHLREFEDWVLYTDRERVEKQITTSVEELGAFYEGVFPHVPAIYEYLQSVELDEMTDQDRALLCLGIMLMEISNGVEYYSPESTAAEAMPRFAPYHDPLFGWQGKPPSPEVT